MLHSYSVNMKAKYLACFQHAAQLARKNDSRERSTSGRKRSSLAGSKRSCNKTTPLNHPACQTIDNGKHESVRQPGASTQTKTKKNQPSCKGRKSTTFSRKCEKIKKPAKPNKSDASFPAQPEWAVYSKEFKDDYVAKPSKRTRNIKEFWEKDGDTWIEIKVFTGQVKRSNKEPIYRSLFYSLMLQIAYWDEPPTGASHVVLTQNKGNRRYSPRNLIEV